MLKVDIFTISNHLKFRNFFLFFDSMTLSLSYAKTNRCGNTLT